MKVQKVSLENIAKLAGVHKATVSRSLRNHPTIPKETRDRIQQIAKELGYRPNPLVSMFQSQARASRPERMQATLAWFNDYPDEACWRDFPWLRGYLDGARTRCEEMGYRLQQINVTRSGKSFEQDMGHLVSQLTGQGIYGMVLPLVLDGQFLQYRWDNCVIALIGGGHRHLPTGVEELPNRFYPQRFPSADRDLFYNARLAYQNLLRLGYHKIGFVYSTYLDDEADGRARSGYLVERSAQPDHGGIPVLMLNRFKEGRPVEFDAWFHQYSPDAILCVNPIVRSWVEDLGFSVPGDVGLANLNIVEDVNEWSGISENHEAVGAAAVDLILSALSRNEIGLPPQPRKILVPGKWLTGTTLKGLPE